MHSEEQDEYNYVKQLNIQSKEEYVETSIKIILKILKNTLKQMEFGILGIDTKKFIQHKYDWIKFCKEKNITVKYMMYYQ